MAMDAPANIIDPNRDHILGDVNADHTILIYGDYHCPFCHDLRKVVKALIERRDSVRIVYRHFPLTEVHPDARKAAAMAEAAGAEGRFWEMHDLLYERGETLNDTSLQQLAYLVDLDPGQLVADIDAGTYDGRIDEDIAAARAAGASGTPALFIDGQAYEGAWDLESLDEAISPPTGVRVERAGRRFSNWAASGGVTLLAAAVVALVWANLAPHDAYEHFWEQPLALGLGDGRFSLSLREWINDGLMVLFFVVVGLEIKREVLLGELADPKAAILPIAGALGGMVAPVVIYLAFNAGGAGAAGWGVPMATDIAFALGLIALLGNRVPYALMIFISALAIVDDLGAILVIALFYAEAIDLRALGAAGLIFAGLMALSRVKVTLFWPYVFGGVALWIAVLLSGVHATAAGVLLALAIPLRQASPSKPLLAQAATTLHDLEGGRMGPAKAVRVFEQIADRLYSPADRLRGGLEPWTAYFILPQFALANCGVVLSGADGLLTSSVFWGVGLGLLVGKPLGITIAAMVVVRLGLARLPDAFGWRALIGASGLCGVGFTMAIFIAGAGFAGSPLLTEAKIGVLVGSFLAGAAGWWVMRAALDQRRATLAPIANLQTAPS